MHRRPFLQQLGLVSASLWSLPALSMAAPKTVRAPKLKFITASDGHWGQPNTDFEVSHRALIEAVNREKDVDFVVLNGDLIHDTPSLLPEVRQVYDQFQMPWYVTRGNHDRVGYGDFMDIMRQPTNFGFIEKDSYGVLLLDSSNEAGDYLCADLDFARLMLDEYATLPAVFVFIHISQSEWTRNGIDCLPLLDLLASYPNVRATFHGHDHDVDGQMIYKKKPFLWSGHFGGSWGNPFPSYRVCEVGEDGKAISYLKTVTDGTLLNRHNL